MKTANTEKIIVHGHRGSRGTHPENTLIAFAEAVAAGADFLELDLQLSSDGVPVLSHDPVLHTLCLDKDSRPVTNPVPIRSLTLKEIQEYDCGQRGNPKFPEQKKTAAKIPSLEEFLIWAKTHAPGLRYNIETKMVPSTPELQLDPHEFTQTVVEVLRKQDALGKTVLQSFDFRTLTVAKALAPELRLSALFWEPAEFCRVAADLGAHIVSPAFVLVTLEEVQRCHEASIEVLPWTANEAKDWDKLVALKVDGIITDFPRKLVQHLHHQED